MKNKLLIAFLALPLICLIAWSSYLVFSVSNGKEVKVAITGYDPRDLLSGHYISYQINWDKTDCSQFTNNICPKDEFCLNDCRYYIPEENATALDKLFRQNNNNSIFEVVYSYKSGRKPISIELLIDGNNPNN